MRSVPSVRCPAKLVGTPGQIIKIKRGGPGKNISGAANGRRQKRGYYLALRAFSEQSRAMGWFNGERLKPKGKT